MQEHAVVYLAGIGILAIACQWFAWWVKLPAILFLLVAGILAGPVAGWLDPDAVFGGLLFPIIELSVAVILFEGSLSLHLDEIRGLERVVRRLVGVGVLVTWAVVTLATHVFVGFSWAIAILFGAMTVVTGPTVIVPMLRTVRPKASLASILRWEGIIIDPVGALLAVLVFEFIVSGAERHPLGHTLKSFAEILLIGGLLGIAAGYFLGVVLRRHWMPEYLHNVATLTVVIGIFSLANVVQPESGLLAVTVMGLWLANMKGVPIDDILDFKESLSVLLISGLFIILAARIDFREFELLGWGALGVFLVMQFVARPLKAAVATWGSSLDWRERALIGWIAPRGIVAAAMAALFAIRLQAQGFAEAPLLVPLTFLVIIGTVALQSATARPLAMWLRVAEPEPRGFLIVGANPLARAIAAALNEKGFRTLLADGEWDNVRAALMEGHDVYYGNVVSEHADRHLDLVGIGRLLALCPRREVNALAVMRYASEFGRDAVFSLRTEGDQGKGEKARTEAKAPGRRLFGEDVTYQRLTEMMKKGARIRSTKLTESFDFAEYYRQHFGRGIPLFAIDQKGRLHPFVVGDEPEPKAGWTLLGLIEPDEEETTDEYPKALQEEGASAHTRGGAS